jgi:hypothetical protein
MNHWPFIIAAYGTTLGSTLGLVLWAWLSMRRAEAAAEQIKRK